MMPIPPDDDRCQVSMCHQAHFTYCPHCKLFVCIEHLNEHYSNYKEEYQMLLNDGRKQQILNKQFINEIDEERQRLINIFNREIQHYEENEKYFHEKSIQSTIRPQDCSDLRSHVLQSSQKRLKFQRFMHQIQQLISEYDYHQLNGINSEAINTLTEVKTEHILHRPRPNKTSPLAQFSIDYEEIDDNDNDDDEQQQLQPTETENHSVSGMKQSENANTLNGTSVNTVKANEVIKNKGVKENTVNESSLSDDDIDDKLSSDTDHRGLDPDFGSSKETKRKKKIRKKDTASSRPAVNHFQVNECPLTNKLYGIDLKVHPLRHVPCSRVRVVRHIMYNGIERDYDLFSQSIEPLVSVLPKSFRGRCPLTKLGAFGLTKFHDIRLCQEHQTNESTGLLNHLVLFHCLSYPWANKLCNAVQAGDYDGSKQILFKPNEPIKDKKWLTTKGKQMLAKRHSFLQKRKKTSAKKMSKK